MSDFSSQQNMEGDKLVLSFAGPIDENTKFPAPDLGGMSSVVLDLDAVTYINSIGIKVWIQWISPISEKYRIEFRRCPKSIIFQINMVKNFLPPNAYVSSFYLPLYCENTETEASALLNVDTDLKIEDGNIKIIADLNAAAGYNDGKYEFEVDVIEKKYFRFLQQS